jgi:hypothetical protein
MVESQERHNRVEEHLHSDGRHTTGHEGFSTTDCRGARRLGLTFRLTASKSAREANVFPAPRTA